MRHVRRMSELHPFDIADPMKKWRANVVCFKVVLAIDQESGHSDQMYLVRNVPIIVDFDLAPNFLWVKKIVITV